MESKHSAAAIPCHLIAGPLGVGKTTAIRRFIAQSSGFTAVIVNDFGKTGYDAAFIAEAGGADKLRVENIPGGCLCCTSVAQLLPALEMLCARPEVERIIIEPSGMALIDPLLDMLHDAAPKCGFELAPVIVLFDPAKTRPASLKLIPYWNRLAGCAGIVVANRCDLASPAAVEQFFQCLETWEPPKLKVIKTSHGELPPELFELRGHAVSPDGHSHPHAELPPAGSFCSDGVFRLAALFRLLEELAPQLDRFKGVFQTDQGRQRLEISAGLINSTPATGASRTAAEWIGGDDRLIERINACLI
ncbi:MAG: GTP-binding protein [Kiritimatiellales bacterium]